MTKIYFITDVKNEGALWSAFFVYYTILYQGWTEEQLGFDPKKLGEWLRHQFDVNNGDIFLVDDDSHELGFMSFKLLDKTVEICQVVGTKHQRNDFFKLLVKLYPNYLFYGVIRKQNKQLLDYYLSIGCRIVENRNSSYDSKYYCGVEMNANQLINKNEKD